MGRISLIVLILTCLLAVHVYGHGHHHDHDHHGHDHDHHGHSHDEPPSYKYSKAANSKKFEEPPSPPPPPPKPALEESDIWLRALGSTLLISIAPYLILYLVPVDGSVEKRPFLKVLLAFASGGLLGDAFLHLIPHAIAPHGPGEHEHSHSHSHEHGEHKHDMTVGLGVLGGILTFLIIEKFVRIVSSGHGHSHGPSKSKKTDDKPKKTQPPKNEVKIAGYLNLAADFAHNFTDGLAIGASYVAGNTIGVVTTLTILFHEVPHEIGDFAILLQSGCSRRKAMSLQLLTAVGAFAGTALSLSLQDNFEAISSLILPFTAGGFIYVATVSVIPDLLEDSSTKYVQSLKEIVALLVGVGMMVVIAQIE